MGFLYMLISLCLASCFSASVLNHSDISLNTAECTENIPLITPEIVGSIPHLSQSFTQGLLWHNGSLFESVGLYGKSEIRELDAKTGKLIRKISNAPEDFGEGIALFDDILVQLSWREGYALRWALSDFSPVEPRWHFQGSGWGLSYIPDIKYFIRSDGSSFIHFHNNNNFAEDSALEVRRAGIALSMINELEYAKGRLYANRYAIEAPSQKIFEIDPMTGNVSAEILMGSLCMLEKAYSEDRILNGIAYNPIEDVFYVTGKNWDNIYIVRW